MTNQTGSKQTKSARPLGPRAQRGTQKTLLIVLAAGMIAIWGSLAAVLLWPKPDATQLPAAPSAPAAQETPQLTPSPSSPSAWPATWTPTVTPTVTDTPTITPTRPPTQTPRPTATPRPPATPTPEIPECECTGDLYDCEDFATQAAAQACYDRCRAPGYGDIHRLDWNDDGIACN